MKTAVFLFISIILCRAVSFGQTKAKVKLYVSETLEYLHLINDSALMPANLTLGTIIYSS